MKLEESTFTLYAIKYYDNPHCNSIEEYEDDVKRIKHIKKLISKYKQSGEINERLLLNHLIVFYNCFGSHGTNMLFMKLENYHSVLKPFVIALNYLPVVVEYNGKTIYTKDIPMDMYVVEKLKNI